MAVEVEDFMEEGGGGRWGLASVANDGDWRRGQRMIEGVGREAWMQKFNVPPRVVAKNDGIKVGEGGEDYCGREWKRNLV